MRWLPLIVALAFLDNVAWAAFGYKASVTVAHAYVPNTDQTDFPILVSGTYDGTAGAPNLKTIGNSGHVQNANGYDIQFFSDSGLTTRIPAERESYNAATGVVVFWVKKTVLTGSDVTIYIGYGDSGISTDPNSDGTYGATSTWDGNFKSVWHLASPTSPTDSVGNNNGTNNGTTATAGNIDGAANLSSASSQYIATGTTNLPTGNGALTLEAWVYSGGAATFQAIDYFGSDSTNLAVYLSDGEISADTFAFSYFGGQFSQKSALPINTWHHVAGTWNGTTGLIYVDGVVGTGATPGAMNIGSTYNNIGRYSGGLYFNGKIDEVRISNTNRSADWIKTEYNNQSSPSTFYTMGSETSTSGTAYVPINRGLSIQGGRTKITGGRVKVL